jgi:farnesyl diphosphate synthase
MSETVLKTPELIAAMDEAELAELQSYTRRVIADVEEELNELLPPVDESDEAQLFEAMRYAVFAGGKRVRPLLVLATHELLGGEYKDALKVAAAIEILHTYSLIHDDMPCMDDDDLRRGQPTIHKKYDECTAVLAGDGLQALCFEVLSWEETHRESLVRAQLVNAVAKACGPFGMVGGQMIDMLEHDDEEVDQGALARLQRKKTGALFSACCEAAVIINRATRDEHHRLASYARNLGLAFQMTDDVLDVTGDRDTLGKTPGKDQAQGKATFATLLGVEGAQRQAEFLCSQAIDYLAPFGNEARILKLLARFVATRSH